MRDLLQAIARLPQVRGSLLVEPIAGTPDGFCLVRTDAGAKIPVALVMGVDAPGYAKLLANAPAMLDLLATVLTRWGKAVAKDEDIDGGDAVEWLSAFTTDVGDALEHLIGPETPTPLPHHH